VAPGGIDHLLSEVVVESLVEEIRAPETVFLQSAQYATFQCICAVIIP
jgi:hypothetical protein